ncbi:Nuclease SbcCD subunit D [Pseudovibrio sp. Ad46]|uniref:exonuclease subunit SbcD n=1 Tax=Pseudovibrio sp. Ad46 TaxID=989432 RepID=UPI0007AEBA3E|nr:exonuclease subunit SbcD [Pseudovibrio sp. Ad46]KZK77065.1 Nuclease SbcCD subunit D [Pseudovibrio sp. Ad46]
MALKILHTADWHIGQSLNGWSRTYEHQQFFMELEELIERHEVDALVVAGDVFDNQNPSADATQMLYEALARFREKRPHLVTVLTAGNHDPAGRVEAPGVLFQKIGVQAVGMVRRKDGLLDLSHHLVPLHDTDGAVKAYVLALPFPRATDLPGLSFSSSEEGSPVVRAVAELYEAAVSQAREQIGEMPLIATGHLNVVGGYESEGAERRILIGGEHAMPWEQFPDDLSYLALGHLHKPQIVGKETIRYSGSPFPLSVAEQHYKHSVNLLSYSDAGVLSIERLPLSRPVPFHRLKGDGGLLLEELVPALVALELDGDLPVEQQPFVHVDLRPQVSAGGLKAEVDQVLAQYPVRSAGVSVLRQKPQEPISAEAESLIRLSEIQPDELFKSAFERVHGIEPEAKHLDYFYRAIAEAEVE